MVLTIYERHTLACPVGPGYHKPVVTSHASEYLWVSGHLRPIDAHPAQIAALTMAAGISLRNAQDFRLPTFE